MNNTSKILLGVLAGAAAGAILGVLMAPDKGSATRKKLAKQGEDYADAIKDKLDEILDGVTEKINNVKDEALAIRSNGKAKVEEYKKDAKAAIG